MIHLLFGLVTWLWNFILDEKFVKELFSLTATCTTNFLQTGSASKIGWAFAFLLFLASVRRRYCGYRGERASLIDSPTKGEWANMENVTSYFHTAFSIASSIVTIIIAAELYEKTIQTSP